MAAPWGARMRYELPILERHPEGSLMRNTLREETSACIDDRSVLAEAGHD